MAKRDRTLPQDNLEDTSLDGHELNQRVTDLRDAYFQAVPEICTERARLLTEFHLENELFDKGRISILDKAKAYRFVLEKRTPVIWHQNAREKGMNPFDPKDTSLFAGSTTRKFKGVPLYPEFLALTLWPELWTITNRQSNPYWVSDEDVEELNYDIFPHWIDNNIAELARKKCFEENLKKSGIKRQAPEIKLLESLVFFITTKPNCISHTIPDFSKAIEMGLRGIIDDAGLRALDAKGADQQEFYLAIQTVLEGVIAYAHRLSQQAEEMAGRESNQSLKKELLDIARIYKKVPESPATSFREALTTVWLCWIAIHLENPNVGLSLGRLDQVLYDLYRKDAQSGLLSVDQAIELLSCFWLKIGDHVPTVPEVGEQLFGGTGSNQAITIGGVDRNGNDAVNDLTYVMLKVTEMMRLRDPNLNARYYSGINSPEYLRRLCEVNVDMGATPALHNDKAVIKALTGKGIPVEDARDFGVIGCVEPGSSGRTYGHTGSILLNLTSALELTLFNGKHRHTGIDHLISKETGDPAAFSSFEAFTKAFKEQVCWLIEQATTLNDIFGRIHQDFYPTPILSSLFEGPMDKGKDLIQGGAVFNSSGIAIIGFADVVDCLAAIQNVIYEEREVSFKELLAAVNCNFEGFEVLQTKLMNPDKTPKYGNEDPIADQNAKWLIELLDETAGEKINYRGGRYHVGCWSMTNHAGFGRLTKATPSGRKDYENFASGFTPVSGVTPDLAKALGSAASLPAICLANGVALNIKYTPEPEDRGKMLDNFTASVEAYFDDLRGTRHGGLEVQFNVTSHDTFVDAVAHPEKYPELLVRVSGYTAYFKDLSPQMKKEVIDRTEYLLSTGNAEIFQPFSLAQRS